MGRFADIIRCHILEEYMASYMRERGADAMLVLRNESKWALTGNYLRYFSDKNFSLIYFLFVQIQFLIVIFVSFSRF